MAKLVSKPQPLRAGVQNPRASYSRVVSCVAYVDEVGTHARGYTTSVGTRVWLLGVDVWFSPAGEVPGRRVEMRVLTGTGHPAGPGQILSWENVLPLNFPDGGDKPWVQEGCLEHMSWNMCQLFEGKERKFGIWIKMSPMEQVLNVYASFEISEG